MKETNKGLRSETGFLAEQLARMPELSDDSMPRLEIVEYQPVIDSSDMLPSDWLKIADDIGQRYGEFDGFVVLHGTDTMAYTASALPFMLGPLSKPIILTGSQLPLAKFRSDGRENLKTAIVLASDFELPEVCLLFGEHLLRGCRAMKSSAESFDAFESPNFEPLGKIGASIDIEKNRLRPSSHSNELELKPIHPHEIATFRLFPGMSREVLKNVLGRPLKALIIESYGKGNGPCRDPEFLQILREASDDGIVLVNCSQCKNAMVTQSAYETGRALQDAGAVSGRDMTLEATIAKLHFLFSQYEDREEIKRLISCNLVGELTDS